jgi:hypothetical protein
MSTAYVGDGVYVAIDSGDVVLTTSDGRSVTNLIVLEPAVLQAFLAWVERQQGRERHDPKGMT